MFGDVGDCSIQVERTCTAKNERVEDQHQYLHILMYFIYFLGTHGINDDEDVKSAVCRNSFLISKAALLYKDGI